MLQFNKEVGYPNEIEKEGFVEYLLMFYGKDEKDACYPEVGMTKDDAVKFMNIYLEGDFKGHDGFHLWGGGDTIDREKVCQLFLEAK